MAKTFKALHAVVRKNCPAVQILILNQDDW